MENSVATAIQRTAVGPRFPSRLGPVLPRHSPAAAADRVPRPTSDRATRHRAVHSRCGGARGARGVETRWTGAGATGGRARFNRGRGFLQAADRLRIGQLGSDQNNK